MQEYRWAITAAKAFEKSYVRKTKETGQYKIATVVWVYHCIRKLALPHGGPTTTDTLSWDVKLLVDTMVDELGTRAHKKCWPMD